MAKLNVQSQYSTKEYIGDIKGLKKTRGRSKIVLSKVDRTMEAGCHNGEGQNTMLENVDALDMYVLDRWGKLAHENAGKSQDILILNDFQTSRRHL